VHKGKDHEIREALLRIKEAIDKDCFNVWRNKKNNEFLSRNGMTPRERLGLIRGLRVVDYWEGPEREYNSSGDPVIWKFKRRYASHEIYIKIKLIEGENGFNAVCLSFHDD
jgi:hypothetical protein